jgi:hypothetical protein
LALVGEIQIAVRREHQIVAAAKPLQTRAFQHRRHGTSCGIHRHDAVAVVRDEYPSVLVDFKPIRFAVIFRDDTDGAVRSGPENPAMRDIDAIEIASAVE